MASVLHRLFPASAERAISRYLGGQFASVVGCWIQNITLSLLIWQQTHSAFMVGLLNFLLQGPMLFIPIVAGARLHPATVRSTTLVVLSCSLAMSSLLLGSALADALAVWFVLLLAACLGVIQAIEWPCRQLLLSTSLLDRSLLTNALAMNALIFNVGRMVGPAIAALLFTHSGVMAGFGCAILGLLAMLHAIRGLPVPQPLVAPGARRAGLGAAMRFVAIEPFALTYVPALACFGLFAGSYQTVIPALAATVFGSLSKFTGIFFACAGGGALCAAVTLSAMRNPKLAQAALRYLPLACALALTGIGLSSSPMLTGLCFFLVGLSISLSTTQINAGLQQRSPAEHRGGVMGIYAVAFIGSMPIGHMVMGGIASRLGPRPTFLLMGLGMAAVPWLLRIIARRLSAAWSKRRSAQAPS